MTDIACVRDRHELRRRAGLLTIQETADLIGADHWQFRYLITVGRVVGPSIQIGGKPRKYYLAEELDDIRSCLERNR